MAFETFDLGRILQTAQAIKGMKQQAESDKLRDAYLGQQMTLQKQQADVETQAREARTHYLAAQAVESAADPIAAARELAPEMVSAFEQQHGPGTFQQLPPEVVKQLASMGKQRAAAMAGISLQGTPEQQFAASTAADQAKTQHGYRLGEIAATGAEARKTAATRIENEKPPSGYRYNAHGNLEFIPGGPADPSVAANQRTLRPIPASAAQGIIENRASMKKIDRALASVAKNPDAFGMQNVFPDAATQRLPGKSFKGGIEPRAQVADIGSLIIHDRSGAAVTAAEFPRLKPFIPQSTDDAKTVATKLKNLRANLESMQEEIESFYTPDSGYRPLPKPEATEDPLGIR